MIVIKDAKTARMDLQQLIRHVKTDLLAYQKEHRGEPALFDIQEVTLEATVATTIEPNGTVKLIVVELGSKATQATTHKVTIKLAVSKEEETPVPGISIDMSAGDGPPPPEGGDGADDGGGFSREFMRATSGGISVNRGRRVFSGIRKGYVRPFGPQVRRKDVTKFIKKFPKSGEGEVEIM